MERSDRKSGYVRLLFAVLFSLAVGAGATYWRTSIYLDSVVVVEYHDGMIYGIDSDDYLTTLFCVDPLSEVGTYYSRDYSDSIYRQFCELVVADDGTVYVLQEKTAAGDGKAWAALVWDTGKNKVYHGADIELAQSDASLKCLSAMGDTIQMLFETGSSGDETTFRRYVLDGNAVREAGTYKVGFNCHDSFLLEDGRAVFVDAFGRVFRCEPDAAPQPLTDDAGDIIETNGTRFSLVGHRLYYKDYLTEQCFMIDMDDEIMHAELVSEGMALPSSFDFYSTSYIRYDKDWTMVSAVTRESTGDSVVGYYGITDKVINQIKPTDVDILRAFVPAFVLSLLITMPVAIYARSGRFLHIRSIKGRLGIYALVLIAAVCAVYEIYLRYFVDDYATHNAINNCSAMARIKEYDLNKTALDGILAKGRVSPTDEQRIWLTSQFDDMMEYDADGMLDRMKFRIFYPADGTIYSADQDLRYNLPLYMIAGRPVQTMVEETLDSGEVQSRKLVYEGDKIVAVFVPGTTASGHKYVLEAYMTIDEIIIGMQQMNRRMAVFVLLVGLAIVLGICTVIAYCLRPLSYLKDAVMRVAEGELGVQARVVGHNEVASTVMSFNRMSQVLERMNGVVDSYKRLYEAFVPMKLCEKLSGKDDLEISLEPGSSYSGDAYIMSVRFWGEEEDDVRREFYDTLLGICTENGGIAATLAGRQRIVFCDSADSAVESATAVLQQLRDKLDDIAVYIGISSADATVHVIGSELRRSMTLDEGEDEFALGHIAMHIDASLLVDETVMQRLHQEVPGKYHSRYLGRLALLGEETVQAVYEILDGEPQADRELKQMTAANFERGVRAYEQRDMFTARTEMIRVKMDYPKDRAARGYILCCGRKEPPEVCQVHGNMDEGDRDAEKRK